MARNTDTKKEPKKQFTLPEGRMINGSLFDRDAFNEKDAPAYKIEVAIDPKLLTDEFIDEILEEVAKQHKMDFDEIADMYDSGDLKSPFLDGDKMASKRERKGKPGDAYKGKIVIRAKTIYDREGSPETNNGVMTYDEEVNEVKKVGGEGVFYNGCEVTAAVTVNAYETNEGELAFSFYLVAVQKIADGEKLTSPADHSNLFKPVGRDKAGAGATRRRRAG